MSLHGKLSLPDLPGHRHAHYILNTAFFSNNVSSPYLLLNFTLVLIDFLPSARDYHKNELAWQNLA